MFSSCVIFPVIYVVFHPDGDTEESHQGSPSSDPMDSLYRDVLKCQKQISPEKSEGQQSVGSSSTSTSETTCDPPQSSQSNGDQSKDSLSDNKSEQQQYPQDQSETDRPGPSVRIDLNQPVGSLGGASIARSGKPLTVTGEIGLLTDEEILNNRESEEEIRSIARFRSYKPGKPSKVV